MGFPVSEKAPGFSRGDLRVFLVAKLGSGATPIVTTRPLQV